MMLGRSALTRRGLLLGISAAVGASSGLEKAAALSKPARRLPIDPIYYDIYGEVAGEPFPVPAVDLRRINPAYLRREVVYLTAEKPGTVIIDPNRRYLYLIEAGGRAIRYGVGVGRQGFGWSGTADIRYKQEWPKWFPPPEMIERQPELQPYTDGMPGGPGNPLGCRAMYLWQGNKDTLYRIHGTIEPWTIGTRASSGCIRMINQDAIDLYNQVPIGTKVIVLPSGVS